MRAARAPGDLRALMEADPAFHAAVPEAAGNEIPGGRYHRLRGLR
ncbi:hypothetical protein [Micromonospora psammae]